MILEPKENETSRASLELVYHVSRELTSALELHTVLERVLFLSMRYVGAMSGSIIVVDDHGKAVESAIINGDVMMNNTTQQLRATLDRGLAGWVLRNRTSALVPDTSKDSRWMARAYEAEEKTEPRSVISAPLMVHDRMVGVLTLVHRKANFFNEEHLNLFQAIADQSGIAVLNGRLYADSRRQARVMTALAETAATITGSLNLEDVLLRIMEQTTQALAVQAVSLALLDSTSSELTVRAAAGWANKNTPRAHIKVGQSIAGWVAREGRGAIINDVSKDPRFDPETDQRTGLATRAIACAPLRYRGQVIGILEAINPSGASFDPDALLVLSGIGSIAGTAVRHAQLFERLQAAHQSYHELFDDSIDSIFISDWSGRIIEANRRALLVTEHEKSALVQMSVGQLLALDSEALGENFEKLASGATISYESRLRTRSEHEIPIEAYVRQVVLEGSTHVQWILRDITERKNLDDMRADLISMIYHDLRSPLGNIVSSLDVLDTMLSSEDEGVRSLMDIAMRSVERIQRLTNSLLDINRLEAGQPVGSRQAGSAIAIIQECVELIQPVTESKQQTVSTELPTELPEVYIDTDMIRRVVMNLLENASKYCPSGASISAGARQDGDMVEVWVADTGPGIPASEHERIFDKFTRLGSREKAKGLGLGLAYCRLAVQAHEGRIWLESEPGHGARFIFTLPILQTKS